MVAAHHPARDCRWIEARVTMRRAFTLVEILIVVVILGILATIVVPQFSDAADTARENTMREDLRFMRTQITIYTAQHNGTPPGYPPGSSSGATEQWMIDQLTRPTDFRGNPGDQSDATYRFGPYLSQIPANPMNSLRTVRIVGAGAFPDQAQGTHGWIYQPSTATFASDIVGEDKNGVAYIDY